MRIGSLFSGAGGLDLGVRDVFGGDVVWHCENDPAASVVLAHHWPGVPNLGDITAVNWRRVPPVDVLCGGFPCQDVSAAAAATRRGIRKGTRSGLWSVFADAIDVLRPQWVVIENVKGLLSAQAHRDVESRDAVVGDDEPVLRAAGAVCGDLASLGYDAQWTTIAASTVGAPHRRERIFIVAHPEGEGRQRPGGDGGEFGLGAAGSALLPTPTSRDHKGRNQRDDDSCLHGAVMQHAVLFPTPTTQDGANNGGPAQFRRNTLPLNAEVVLLPTPSASDGMGGGPNNPDNRMAQGHQVQLLDMGLASVEIWGKFADAIAQWEAITRPAPPPTEKAKGGGQRLSARFSEWLMGWPAGWVDVPSDQDALFGDPAPAVSRTDQLRLCGNGVVPQQAAAAIRLLLTVAGLDVAEVAAREAAR